MIWKHLKNNDLIISSKMSLDAQAMKRSVLPMDSWWSATVKSWIQSAIHCIKLFDYSKNTMGQRTGVNLRGIRAKLEFSFVNTTFTLIFSHTCFKGVINKQAATTPQATTLPIPNFKFLFAFLQISQPFLCFVHRLFV